MGVQSFFMIRQRGDRIKQSTYYWNYFQIPSDWSIFLVRLYHNLVVIVAKRNKRVFNYCQTSVLFLYEGATLVNVFFVSFEGVMVIYLWGSFVCVLFQYGRCHCDVVFPAFLRENGFMNNYWITVKMGQNKNCGRQRLCHANVTNINIEISRLYCL